MGGAEESSLRHREDAALERAFGGEIDRGRLAGHEVVQRVEVLGAAQLAGVGPQQEDGVAGGGEGVPDDGLHVLDHADHPDDRGGYTALPSVSL